MISEIARQLDCKKKFRDKVTALNILRDRLYQLYNEDTRVVVIVDEGQMLKARQDLLGELRILLNFCVADAFLLSFIFSGQKPLDEILRKMPEFWQRLPVRFFLKNLDAADTRNLVRFRISKVAGDPDIFSDDAHEGIFRFSEGCPRIICSVADLCLIIGYANQRSKIGFVEVSHACRDMEKSGDSFHYFHFLHNRLKKEQKTVIRKSAATPDGNETEGIHAPDEKKTKPVPKIREVNEQWKTVEEKPERPPQEPFHRVCVNCGTHASSNVNFCPKCNSPLIIRCPQCGEKQDKNKKTCTACGCNLKEELRKLQVRFLNGIKAFDQLGSAKDRWLKLVNLKLYDKEEVLLAIPRGNFIQKGTSFRIREGKEKNESSPTGCDFVVTDRHLIIRNLDTVYSESFDNIKKCESIREKCFPGIYRFRLRDGISVVTPEKQIKLFFPFSSGQNRRLASLLETFVNKKKLYISLEK